MGDGERVGLGGAVGAAVGVAVGVGLVAVAVTVAVGDGAAVIVGDGGVATGGAPHDGMVASTPSHSAAMR